MERSTMIGLAVGVAALAAGWWFLGRKSSEATRAGKAAAAALAPVYRSGVAKTAPRLKVQTSKGTVSTQAGRDAGELGLQYAADVKVGSDLARSTWGVG